MAKGKEYVVHTEKEMVALASSARQEIVDVLAEMGTVSVAELAAALNRPADGLYFHLRALQKAGLVKCGGVRSSSGRKEALYRTIAPELSLEYLPRSKSKRKRVTAIVGSMLRLGIRDFKRGLQDESVSVSGERRELWALRKTGRLSMSQIADVNRSIKRLKGAVTSARPHGRLYSITVLLTPLERSRTHSSSKRRGSKTNEVHPSECQGTGRSDPRSSKEWDSNPENKGGHPNRFTSQRS
jgi:DNA-binding transcriptional ArsR family regulator